MLTAIDGTPPGERLMFLSECENGKVDDRILSVTDDNGSNMLLYIGIMVEIGSMKGLFVFFDLIALIILLK